MGDSTATYHGVKCRPKEDEEMLRTISRSPPHNDKSTQSCQGTESTSKNNAQHIQPPELFLRCLLDIQSVMPTEVGPVITFINSMMFSERFPTTNETLFRLGLSLSLFLSTKLNQDSLGPPTPRCPRSRSPPKSAGPGLREHQPGTRPSERSGRAAVSGLLAIQRRQ
jgi:hypothetical protein